MNVSAKLILILLFLASSVRGDVFERRVGPFLQKHCVHCHGAKKQRGKFRVDTLTADFLKRENAAAWIEIRDKLNLGEMPPPDESRPSIDQMTMVSRWIAAELRKAERARISSGGRVVLRRMNRHEYANTISDLLHMKFPAGESPVDFLPPDGTAEGFDKVSAALLLDPSLLTLYFRVARRVADRAIVDGPPKFPTKKMRLEFEEIAESTAIGYLVTRPGMRTVPGGLELVEGRTRSYGMLRYPRRRDNNVAPVNGFYRFTIRAGGYRGADGEVPHMILTHSHPDDSMRVILEADVEATPQKMREYSIVVPRDTLGGGLHVGLDNDTRLSMSQRPGENFMRRNGKLGKKGRFAETIRLAGRKVAEGWGGGRSTPDPEKLDLTKYPRLVLDYLEVEGPLYDQWPPKSHSELLFRDPKAVNADGSLGDVTYAREIFTRFLPRAWRRPVTREDLDPIVEIVRTELASGEIFHEAVRVALTAALTSPSFLYLAEPSTEQSSRASNDYEIASRLSYFLWSSMPDGELFDLAASKKLRDPKTLAEQVDRLLADAKSDRFVEEFSRQWLRTDTFLAFAPDRHLYRAYDDKLARSVVREPIEFFRVVLRANLAVLNFLDSNFVVVDERLARHYGLEGVRGQHFRRVPIPENSPRGGLLAMAGVHQAGSDGVRTKPVSRAVWVREVILGDPPDPPPPNAGEIEPNVRGEHLTVRERLIQHQEIDSCAACHRSLDPYGLALENFNVIGAWRDRQDGEKFRGRNAPVIDASGRLPNGAEFSGFTEFRQRLLDQGDRFRRALAEKLFVYALGRPAEPEDDAILNDAIRAMHSRGDTLRTLIHSLVTSKAFLTK